eukprot:scaffold3118_cov64-Cylindrotheca_fusiformis.AAC.15
MRIAQWSIGLEIMYIFLSRDRDVTTQFRLVPLIIIAEEDDGKVQHHHSNISRVLAQEGDTSISGCDRGLTLYYCNPRSNDEG